MRDDGFQSFILNKESANSELEWKVKNSESIHQSRNNYRISYSHQYSVAAGTDVLPVQYACNRKWSILKNERKYLLHKLFSVTYKNFNLDLEHKFTTIFLLPAQHTYIHNSAHVST